MGTFSRLRYVIAANVNALIEKAEDPEKLLRALIREMEDASEEARMACAELLAEQQRLQRLETRLSEDGDEWQRRAENAVAQGRDDLARAALRAKTDLAEQHAAAIDEQKNVAGRVEQMVDLDLTIDRGELLQTERDVLGDRQVWKQGVVLKHHRDIEASRLHLVDHAAVDLHLA